MNIKDDLAIEQIRKVRRKISEEHGHNAEKLIKHYHEIEKQSSRKFFYKEIQENRVA